MSPVGAGDITPPHPDARPLATLEALSGSLLLTLLVTRLVGLGMDWRNKQRERRRHVDDTFQKDNR